MSDENANEKTLTTEDRDKIARLLESGTPENQNLAFSLIEETAGQEDIAEIFTMNVIVELICLKGPESLEAMVRAGHLIHEKCPKTWKVFSEAVVDPDLLTSQKGQAESLHYYYLDRYRAISSGGADQLVANTTYQCISLGGLTFLSDVVAKSLSQFSGELRLDGLTELADAAAESISKHKGGNLHLGGLTKLSDAAAESLGKHHGECLELDGLTILSDAAAESFSKHQGKLSLDCLQHLSEAATASLSKHPGELKTNAKIKEQIKKHASSERKKDRKSARTGETALTKKQATKIRKLLRTKTADNVLLAVQLINDSEITKDDISDVFSASMISLFVNTWDVDVWNALAQLLLEHQVQRQEFTDLVRQRFRKISLDSRTAVAASLFNRAAMPLVPLIKECQILGNCTSDGWGLTELSDAGAQLFVMSTAESLSKHEGELYLNGLTSLSDAAAESLSKHKGELYLNGLTSLSDAAAESLSKHEGSLRLDGLTEISDTAAESLSKHKGDLDLDGLTSLSDAAAESLGKHHGECLELDGLTSLSDAAAESLSKYKGTLHLDGLTSLSDAAAESLSKHKGWLRLNGLTSLSNAAAESLSKHKGDLWLDDLTELSDAAAESLSKHEGTLSLGGLTRLSDTGAHHLAKNSEITSLHYPSFPESVAQILRSPKENLLTIKEAEGFVAGTILFLGTYTAIEDDAAQFLGSCDKSKLIVNDLQSLTDTSAAALSEYPGDLRLLGLKELSGTAAQHLAKHPNLSINLDNLPASAAKILRDAGHGE